MAHLLGVELAPASVPANASFADAADVLTAHPVSTIAVVDERGRVIGVFGGEELLEGLFPAYLKELRHTAFARDDPALLDERAREVAGEPVTDHMEPATTVETAASATHVAERFLHCRLDAIPVVEDDVFVGMLGRSEFCRAMLRRG
jgi:CBS-domain-containing membrane protein